jgi:group I intron endonuclease
MYNFNMTADSRLGTIHTEETRPRMSQSQQQVDSTGANNPPFGRTGANNPMFGQTHNPETIAAIRAAKLGSTHSEESRAKLSAANLGANNPMFGRTGSLSPRYGIASPQAMAIYVYSADSKTLVRMFPSQIAAAEWLGVSNVTVSRYIKSGKVWNNQYVFRSETLLLVPAVTHLFNFPEYYAYSGIIPCYPEGRLLETQRYICTGTDVRL